MNPRMGECSEIRSLLGAAVYNDLDEAERERLERHLASCAACRRERDELGRAAGLVGKGEEDLTSSEQDRLLAGIARRTAPVRSRRFRRSYAPRRSWGPALAASAALAAAVLLAVFSFDRTESAPPEVAQEPAPEPAPAPIPPAAPVPSQASRPDPGPMPRALPPVPPAPRPPAPKPPPQPAPKPVPPRRTVAVVGSLERVHGQVALVKGDEIVPAAAGQEIATGHAVRTMGRQSLAVLKYKDGTIVEIGPDTRVTEDSGAGKKLRLERGEIRAVVAPQPAEHPLIVVTGDAEARVLGTTFRMTVRPGASGLEVREGRVRLTRTADGESVEVTAGHRALVKEGAALTARPARIGSGLLVLYTFRENGGGLIRDVSGTGLPLDLRIRTRRGATWSDSGLTVKPRPRITSVSPATKIIEACGKSGEATLEAWVTPANGSVSFDGAIVAISRDIPSRNLTLVQVRDRYEISLRTSTTDSQGRPVLTTGPGSTPTELTHVVYVRSADGTERLYVNGTERASGTRPGTLASWDAAYPLTLGDEVTEERPWEGTYRMVALYDRALSAEDVAHNFRMGTE